MYRYIEGNFIAHEDISAGKLATEATLLKKTSGAEHIVYLYSLASSITLDVLIEVKYFIFILIYMFLKSYSY